MTPDCEETTVLQNGDTVECARLTPHDRHGTHAGLADTGEVITWRTA